MGDAPTLLTYSKPTRPRADGSVQQTLCKWLRASCSAQVSFARIALCKRICASCSARVSPSAMQVSPKFRASAIQKQRPSRTTDLGTSPRHILSALLHGEVVELRGVGAHWNITAVPGPRTFFLGGVEVDVPGVPCWWTGGPYVQTWVMSNIVSFLGPWPHEVAKADYSPIFSVNQVGNGQNGF